MTFSNDVVETFSKDVALARLSNVGGDSNFESEDDPVAGVVVLWGQRLNLFCKTNNMYGANLCEYFVTIHAQHKIRGIRDASSSGCCRSSLIFVD